jgi:hypothetical protein
LINAETIGEETMNEAAADTAMTILTRAINSNLVITVGDDWKEELEALKILLSDGLAELTVLPARGRGLTIFPTEAGIALLDAVSEIRREEAAEALARTDARVAAAYAEAAARAIAGAPVTLPRVP